MNYFPSGKFFSRTLARTWKSLRGDSDWRSFVLPFDARSGVEQQPNKLELSLVMPGRAEVEITGVDTQGDWWDDRQGGLVGGILGATVGILTGLGKGRRVVLFLMVFTIGGGLVLAVVGLTALGMGQPFIPLLLTGGVTVGVFGINYPTAYLRFQQLELRQMSAQELE